MIATVRELRDNTKHYLDLVEAGEAVAIYRNGKPTAMLSPYEKNSDRFRVDVALKIPGASLSKALLADRSEY